MTATCTAPESGCSRYRFFTNDTVADLQHRVDTTTPLRRTVDRSVRTPSLDTLRQKTVYSVAGRRRRIVTLVTRPTEEFCKVALLSAKMMLSRVAFAPASC